MFDFTSPPPAAGMMQDAQAKHAAASAAIDLIGKMMLQSNLPEQKKIELRIMLETKKLTDKITESFLAFAQPTTDDKTEALYPVRKEVYEYLQYVNVGIDSFLAEHPAPAKPQDNEPMTFM